ncbi:hypothetical protein KC19_11G046300 [Ceratodon purpureus]|uniref:Uncharacterized protein n=1 Tax=Ceratodon purpureus TaxID=3225 RepID=A0A8T0GDB3_CERPU|nr:hypothetical protein KC19_11G046300 [Ceratodon purpureus]
MRDRRLWRFMACEKMWKGTMWMGITSFCCLLSRLCQ